MAIGLECNAGGNNFYKPFLPFAICTEAVQEQGAVPGKLPA